MTKLTKLPPDILKELQEQIRANYYGHNKEISDWLKEKGYLIGKSTIHRYSLKLKALDGYAGKSNTNELLAKISAENLDSFSLLSLFQKLGRLEHEKQKILAQINDFLEKEKA